MLLKPLHCGNNNGTLLKMIYGLIIVANKILIKNQVTSRDRNKLEIMWELNFDRKKLIQIY